MCSTAEVSGGEVWALDLGAEVDAKGSGVERCGILAEVSMLPCVAQVVTGFGKEAGIRRLAVVV